MSAGEPALTPPGTRAAGGSGRGPVPGGVEPGLGAGSAAGVDAEAPAAGRLPLLLLHGLGCSVDIWLPTLRCLEQELSGSLHPTRAGHPTKQRDSGTDPMGGGHPPTTAGGRSGMLGGPVWAPDMPGSGHSPGPPEALGIDALADWAARLLDALAIPRAHVAGHSMGCQVTLALARRHPDRVGRLVLVGPTTGRRWLSPWRYGWGLLRDGACTPALYCRLTARMCREMGLRRYWAAGWKMLADDPCAIAGEVTAPTLVVHGTRDSLVPEKAACSLAAALPHGRFVSIPRCPHVVQYQRPRELTRLLLDFLAEPGA